ncbi:uncharacterized protein L969DRAFT_91630 [Mixia osmundae IAM 14324]|uniref:Uncharacterized protein n=1 Tax=Mixia osmundae (strain CBS 9802 / IAM 14324 / JCM 22182 / KY 12970) TaxID=764103 RepID=G7E014_MIXOS|nr:uncharacterized protein L969DRAFT_91630 [Mixia osmundae IAM 14324]KEI42167.1 hypothetical protein L969DRAFT_91630 [Mixia osmundae IAM 14324]GAA96174.1 hypothetical protein E5Q_02838 [Mixia osmundae IAM 14324]
MDTEAMSNTTSLQVQRYMLLKAKQQQQSVESNTHHSQQRLGNLRNAQDDSLDMSRTSSSSHSSKSDHSHGSRTALAARSANIADDTLSARPVNTRALASKENSPTQIVIRHRRVSSHLQQLAELATCESSYVRAGWAEEHVVTMPCILQAPFTASTSETWAPALASRKDSTDSSAFSPSAFTLPPTPVTPAHVSLRDLQAASATYAAVCHDDLPSAARMGRICSTASSFPHKRADQPEAIAPSALIRTRSDPVPVATAIEWHPSYLQVTKQQPDHAMSWPEGQAETPRMITRSHSKSASMSSTCSADRLALALRTPPTHMQKRRSSVRSIASPPPNQRSASISSVTSRLASRRGSTNSAAGSQAPGIAELSDAATCFDALMRMREAQDNFIFHASYPLAGPATPTSQEVPMLHRINKEVRQATGWRFTLICSRIGATRTTSRYYCSQDEDTKKPSKVKNGQDNVRTGMARFPCNGRLTVSYIRDTHTIAIWLKHDCQHERYKSRS